VLQEIQVSCYNAGVLHNGVFLNSYLQFHRRWKTFKAAVLFQYKEQRTARDYIRSK